MTQSRFLCGRDCQAQLPVSYSCTKSPGTAAHMQMGLPTRPLHGSHHDTLQDGAAADTQMLRETSRSEHLQGAPGRPRRGPASALPRRHPAHSADSSIRLLTAARHHSESAVQAHQAGPVTWAAPALVAKEPMRSPVIQQRIIDTWVQRHTFRLACCMMASSRGARDRQSQ